MFDLLGEHPWYPFACPSRNTNNRKTGLRRRRARALGRQSGPDAVRAAGRSGARGDRSREERFVARTLDRSASSRRLRASRPDARISSAAAAASISTSIMPVQLEQKRAILREVLQRVGKIEFAGEIGVISGEPWQYRNRVQLHIEDGQVGYFAARLAGSHRDRSLPDRFAQAQ